MVTEGLPCAGNLNQLDWLVSATAGTKANWSLFKHFVILDANPVAG